jgi:hypothetical protein
MCKHAAFPRLVNAGQQAGRRPGAMRPGPGQFLEEAMIPPPDPTGLHWRYDAHMSGTHPWSPLSHD